MKTSATVNPAFGKTMRWWLGLEGNPAEKGTLVYGGDDSYEGSIIDVRSWRTVF